MPFWRFRKPETQIIMFAGRYFLAAWRYAVPGGDWLGVVYRDPDGPWIAMFGLRLADVRTWTALEADPSLPAEQVEEEFDKYVRCLAREQDGGIITRGTLSGPDFLETFRMFVRFATGAEA
jgi:hypothetical protein